jgi:hypothetical protein
MIYNVGVTLLVAVPAAAFWRALRQEDLVILHWDRVGFIVLARAEGGRYGVISPARLPEVVARSLMHRPGLRAWDERSRLQRWAPARREQALSARI